MHEQQQEQGAQHEQALRERLDLAREKMEELVGTLQAVDHELEGLAAERHQYRLVEQACASLEELGETGGAALFWSGPAAGSVGEDHLRVVRSRVSAFEKQLGEIEGRRQEIVEEVERERERLEIVEDAIFEIEREAELRKLEWVPDREVEQFALRASTMPWARDGEEDRRFRRTLAATLLLCLLLGLLLPIIDLPIPDPWEQVEVPDRFTRLIAEEPPPPPPPTVQETIPEETETEPTEELVAEEKPEPKPALDPVRKEAVASKGILAFREKFSSLAQNTPDARLGSKARITDAGEPASGVTTRSMVATQGARSSGGINLSSISRNVGGGGGDGIQGVEVARVTSSIGGGGGSERPLAGGPGVGRTDEEIQIVFDRHKASLYRLYNRELRRDPTLRGQIVLRIRIEPDGSVSICELQSTDMDAPKLAAQVVGRVQGFDFGAKEVPPVTILYPIDFLPAT